MRTKKPLFRKWGITFDKTYEVEERAARKVSYADRFELEQEILQQNCTYEDDYDESPEPPDATSGGIAHTPAPKPAEHMSPLRTD